MTSRDEEQANFPEHSKSSDLRLAVGAGVRVPLGRLAIGILIWLFFRERRKAGKLREQWSQQWQAEMERRNGRHVGQEVKGHQGANLNASWFELSNPQPHELGGSERELDAQHH